MFSRLVRPRVAARLTAAAKPTLRLANVFNRSRLLAASTTRAMSSDASPGHGHGHGGPPTSRIKSFEDQFKNAPAWQEREASEKIGSSPNSTEFWKSVLNQHTRPEIFPHTDPRSTTWQRDNPEVVIPLSDPQEEAEGAPWRRLVYQCASLFVVGGVLYAVAAEVSDRKPRPWATPSAHASAQAAKKLADPNAKSGLDSAAFAPLRLSDIKPYNHNTKLFVFDLAEPNAALNLPTASFVLVKSDKKTDDGKDVIRPYTPIDQHDIGQLNLLVKAYPTGALTQWLFGLKVGDAVQFKGPVKKLAYAANMKKELGMIAGGTGITPMLQVVDEVLRNPADTTKVSLLFANDTPADILLRERLDEYAAKHGDRFKVTYVVLKPTADWKGETGYVTEALIAKYLPKPSADSLTFVCGPPPMMKALSGDKVKNATTGAMEQGPLDGVLKKMNYTSENVFKF